MQEAMVDPDISGRRGFEQLIRRNVRQARWIENEIVHTEPRP
jgi:hypothetical protein